MILFPRPRILYVAALALAIPSFGFSMLVFYFVFKRPYDSRATSLILARAKNCLMTGRREFLCNVNRGAIERVFSKFGIAALELRYPSNVPFVRWGVLRHPMINGGDPFTLRVVRDGGNIDIQSGEGEAWWLLQDPSEDVLVSNSASQAGTGLEHFNALIKLAAKIGNRIERPNLKYEAASSLAEMNDEVVDEYFEGYRGMQFWRHIDALQYHIVVRTIDPAREDEGGVSVEASVVS